jgi:antitoxin CptB
MSDINKLRWRCRRGSLELDLILLDYLENHYSQAVLSEQALFTHLLTLEDSELIRYVMGEDNPPRESLALLVVKIRNR